MFINPNREYEMKVALCFFGITRNQATLSTKYLEKNILKPLRQNKISYDIYLHTYLLNNVKDSLNNEGRLNLDNEDWKHFHPNEYVIEDQDLFDKGFDWESIMRYGDKWKNNCLSLRNCIRQLNSLKKVTQLWVTSGKNYDVIIYLRPDQLYYSRIDLGFIIKLGTEKEKNFIVTPNWAQHLGFNDRFYFISPRAGKIIGNRLDLIYKYCETHGSLHSESFLMWTVIENRIIPLFTHMKALRIRADGTIVREKKSDMPNRRERLL